MEVEGKENFGDGAMGVLFPCRRSARKGDRMRGLTSSFLEVQVETTIRNVSPGLMMKNNHVYCVHGGTKF